MTKETSITESAAKILEVLVQRDAVAGHAVMVRDLVAASGLSDSEFDHADTYLLQAKYVEGTMRGRDGSGLRWLTPNGIQFHQNRSEAGKGFAVTRRHERYEHIAVFAFGVTFVVALLVLAIAFPEPKPFQYLVFRIVLALAVAGIAAFVPGFIEVDVSKWLRAGGAIAIFAIIYFFSPANLVTEQAHVSNSQQSASPCISVSSVSNNPANLTFLNSSLRTIRITWRSFDGRDEQPATLKPGRSYAVETYLDHVWCVVDATNGDFIQEVLVTQTPQRVEVH